MFFSNLPLFHAVAEQAETVYKHRASEIERLFSSVWVQN